VLRPLNQIFPAADYPDLLVGLGAPDDAAVYRLNDAQAIITTADFFPPVVDDPYDYGAIAAANALSDVYAMGGEPLFALNLAAFPEDLPEEVMAAILRGGAEKVREAGAVIAGGHTGVVHPARLITRGGARPGDALVLTKPLGAGVITTANKNDKADPDHVRTAVASMSRLNRAAARAASNARAHALTDITGYSLLGHAHEVAHLSGVRLIIDYAALPWLPGARGYAEAWIFPGGATRNADYYQKWVTVVASIADWEQHLLYDPQTSGGLLMAIAAERVAAVLDELRAAGEQGFVIGVAEAGNAGEIVIR